MAEAESRRIVEEADADAAETRRGADEYAASVLIGLEGDVVKTLQSIKRGIDLLDERRAALRDGGEPPEDVDHDTYDDYESAEAGPVRRS